MKSVSGYMTLSEATDEFLIQKMIDRKKYYDAYLIIAKRAWQKIFWNTIYEVQSSWEPVKLGTPYNYIDVPKGTSRIFSISNVDRHGKIQPLYYNNQLNVIPKPTVSACGCTACKCDGLCEDLSALSVTTKLVFTISGVDYYEKTWIKTCPNGDVIKWRELPTKKYNDFVGESGDYNQDYNADYSNKSAASSNFTIVTQTFQEKICSLEVRPCGCPVNTQSNIDLINTHCGCFFPFGFWTRSHQKPKTFLDDINENCEGEVKLSDDGTKIYYKPTRRHPLPHEPLIPDYLLLNRQTTGLDCTTEVLVPEFALDCLWATINYRAIRFNARYSRNDKDEAKQQMYAEENSIIMYLNPLNLDKIKDVQDAPIFW